MEGAAECDHLSAASRLTGQLERRLDRVGPGWPGELHPIVKLPWLQDDLIERIENYARRHPNWIVPGLGIKTNVQVLKKLRERKIKGQLWRLLR